MERREMDWNGSFRPFVSLPPDSSSFGLLYNYNFAEQFPEMKRPLIEREDEEVSNGGGMEKKRRLSNEQLESLERSFQEDIKLDPHRKMKLSKELGLQPRQIAVWFQNRKARWKAKHLEHLYDALKQEFDTVSREKQKLQEEVIKLRTMLREKTERNQVSTAYTDMSGEETVESTTATVLQSSNNYIYNVADFNLQITGTSFWVENQAQMSSYP